MDHEISNSRLASSDHRDDGRQPWVAPQAREALLKDAELNSNPGDDGLGVFTLS